MDKHEISIALDMLINTEVCYIGRIINMLSIEFADKLKDKTYALHVQSSWRMTYEKKIIVGYSDIYEPNSETTWSEGFEWDVKDANLFDEKSSQWSMDAVHKVVSYEISNFGDLTINFLDGYKLQIFVDNSTKDESWRFFELGSDKEHLVIP